MTPPDLLARASDPAAPPEVLRELATRNTELASLVASNPNAPWGLLLDLAKDHPDEVLQNAAFALELVEQPLVLRQLPYGTRRALAQSRHLSLAIARALHESAAVDRTPQIPQFLAANPFAPAALLEDDLLDLDPATRRHAAQNPRTPPQRLALLLRLGADAALSGIQDPGRGDPDVLRQVASLGGWGEVFAAMHPGSPPDLLDRLAVREDFAIRWALAENPSLPEPHLRRLFAARNVHGALAQNPSTPPDILRQLAAHEEPSIRASVAQNPATEEGELRRLLVDPEEGVRTRARAALPENAQRP